MFDLDGRMAGSDLPEKLGFKGKLKGDYADINDALGLGVDDVIDIKDNFAGEVRCLGLYIYAQHF